MGLPDRGVPPGWMPSGPGSTVLVEAGCGNGNERLAGSWQRAGHEGVTIRIITTDSRARKTGPVDEASIPQPEDRAEKSAPATGGAALRAAVTAYTAALAAAFAPCRAQGALQADLAAALNIHPGTMSRYFTGQRILHHDLLPAFARHLAELGHPLANRQLRELEILERNVRRHRSSDGRRIAELEDERDTLRRDLTALQETLRRALAEGHDRDDELAGRLQEARADADRLRRALAKQDLVINTLRSQLTEAEETSRDAEERAAAEAARADELADRLAEADTQLAAAARLVGDADRDAARAEQRATALGAEIETLRRQVRALLEEPLLVPDAVTPTSTHDATSGQDPAQLVPAQLQPPIAKGETTHTTTTGATPPTAQPQATPGLHRRTSRPARIRKRLRPKNPHPGRHRPRPARIAAAVLSLLLVTAAAVAFTAAHIRHFAYTHATLCTTEQISRADTGHCLTQQAATVTDRAQKPDGDSTFYTVTVTTTGGRHTTWNVDEAFHDSARPGTRIAVNTYNGTVVTLTHQTLTTDVTDRTAFLSWTQVAAPLALMTAAAIPLLAVGDRFFLAPKIFGLVPIATGWNAFLALLTFNNWRLGNWTDTTTAVAHALLWALICLPPLAMEAID